MIAKGEKLPNIDEGGYDKDMVQSTPSAPARPTRRARPPRPAIAD